MDVPVSVTKSGNFLTTPPDNHSVAKSQLADRGSFWPSEPIFDHVVGIVLVFSQVIPRSAFEFFTVHCKQLCPRIFSSRSPIARHHCSYRPECNAVAAIAGGNELTLGVLANVRQAVGRGDDLSRPTMIYTRLRNYFFQANEQARVSSLRVALLTCLVVLPAEHDVIEAGPFIDPQIIVRISRIPKDGFRNRPGWDLGAERIAGVEREFSLEKRR